MVNGSVVEMGEGGCEDKEIVGEKREGCWDRNECGYYEVVCCGYCRR